MSRGGTTATTATRPGLKAPAVLLQVVTELFQRITLLLHDLRLSDCEALVAPDNGPLSKTRAFYSLGDDLSSRINKLVSRNNAIELPNFMLTLA